MKKLLVLAISMVFGMSMFLTYAVPVMAGDDMGISESCPMPSMKGANQYTFGGTSHKSGYMGALAVDRQYNDLGRVVDVLTGGGSEGGVDFLVVSSCLPGMNGRLVAIPFSAIENHPSFGTVITGVTKEDFQKAPSISSDEMNGLGWSRWVQEDYKYFEKTF